MELKVMPNTYSSSALPELLNPFNGIESWIYNKSNDTLLCANPFNGIERTFPKLEPVLFSSANPFNGIESAS